MDHRLRQRRLLVEPLEKRLLLDGQSLVISEFMAINDDTLADGNGEFKDWIEIFNPTADPVDLTGWYLTDDADELDKWPLPARTINAGEYLVVFASGQDVDDYVDPGGYLHTNFKLDGDGEDLALVAPDGQTVVHAYWDYPSQVEDVSYGVTYDVFHPVSSGMDARFWVPDSSDAALEWTAGDPGWTAPEYDDAAWPDTPNQGGQGATGIGYSNQPKVFDVTTYGSKVPLVDLAQAEAVLADVSLQNGSVSGTATVINYLDSGSIGRYSSDNPFPGIPIGMGFSNYLIEATASVLIPSAGEWTFGVNSNDGFSLELTDGTESFSMEFPGQRSAGDTLSTFTFANAGTYDLRLVMFQYVGGAEVELFAAQGSHDVFDPAAFALVGDVASGGLPLSPMQTDVEDIFRGVSTSLWTRIPFEVDDPTLFDSMVLGMQYNDGFVAYLNGQEIARRHAPDPIQYNSAATAAAPVDDPFVYETFDVTAALDVIEEGTNTLAIHGLNYATDDPEFLITPELSATSELRIPKYMVTPTPGQDNVGGALGFVTDTHFSVDRGFYDTPQTVEISTDTLGATIYYTLDGSTPTEAGGIEYTGPLTLSSTTTLRAAAFKPGYEPSNVDTHTYLFNQSDAIKSLPVISLAADPDGTFSVDEGLWADVLLRGREAEFPVSFEIIRPEDNFGLQLDAGIRLHGSSYRRRTIGPNPSAKWSFKIYFRDEYDENNWLEYELIERSSVERYKTLTLRSGYNDSSNPFIKDELARRLHKDMGAIVSNGTFANVFINGQLKNNGYYNPVERHDERMFQEKLGTDLEFDVVTKWSPSGTPADPPRNHNEPYYFDVRDGNEVSFAEMLDYALANDLTQPQHYEEMAQRLDIPSFIDYLILQGYARIRDWPHNNWNAARARTDGDLGKWRFYAWDLELGWSGNELTDTFKVPGGGTEVPLNILFDNLKNNVEFRQVFADRAQAHFFHGGALSPENVVMRFEELRQEMAGVLPNMNTYIRDTFAPQRPGYVLSSMTSMGLFTFEGPRYAINGTEQHGGAVSAGDGLTMLNPSGSGTIYYTLDGSDPRLPGGAVNLPSAQIYDGSAIPLTDITLVRARTFDGGQWSGLVEARFIVDAATAANLAVTEVHYHPADADVARGELDVEDDSFEFIELLNTSSDTTINLTGVRFLEDITFDFSDSSVTELAPGECVLVVENQAAFESRYGTGFHIAGEYDERLGNDGDLVQLVDATGATIQQFTYDDMAPWPEQADGPGFSLEVIDPTADYDDPANWRPSSRIGGTPGVAGGGAITTLVDQIVFYNHSVFDGDDPAATTADDAAIAVDKAALLFGETAALENYTSYAEGINGLMLDVANLPAAAALGNDDFAFRLGNDDTPDDWAVAPNPFEIAVRRGAGANSSDRVTLIWEDGVLVNTWLQVTVNATADTGLAEPVVFYFGNAVGESGNSRFNAMVTSVDEIAARHNPLVFTPAAIDNLYDFNRDGRVTAVDQIIARRNVSVVDSLELITPPDAAPPPVPVPAMHDAVLSTDDWGFLLDSDPYSRDGNERDDSAESPVDRLLWTLV